jgi:hypothetical protein
MSALGVLLTIDPEREIGRTNWLGCQSRCASQETPFGVSPISRHASLSSSTSSDAPASSRCMFFRILRR